MINKLVNAESGKILSQTQYNVFRKIMSIYGPKRYSQNAVERWLRAYCKAQKDFEDIYGFKPELRYMEDEEWKRFENH